MTKPFWVSKTLWINLLAIIAIIAQGVTGNEVINAEAQVGILALINLVLRLVTKEPINWRK